VLPPLSDSGKATSSNTTVSARN